MSNVEMHVNAAIGTLWFRSVRSTSLSQPAIRSSSCLTHLRATLLASDKNPSRESMSGRAVVRDKTRVARHTRRLTATSFYQFYRNRPRLSVRAAVMPLTNFSSRRSI